MKNNNDIPLPKNDTNHRKWLYAKEQKIMMFLCLKKWQESHKMTLHYEQIWFMIDCERITSKFCVIFPKISRVFPPRYLNFHPKSKHLQTVKFLKTEFSLSFQKKEHINFIATYYNLLWIVFEGILIQFCH